MTSMNEMFPSYTTDASFTKPEAMVVPCIWDNKQKIYVPVYSHRGVEIQNRIEELEAALRDVYEVYAGSEGIPQPMTAAEGYLLRLVKEMANAARTALGEKKDG